MRGKISPSAFRSPRRVLLPVPPRRPWAQRYTVPLFPPENKNALSRLHCSGRSMTVVPPGFPHYADTHVSVTGVPVRLTLFSARQLQGDFPTSCTRAYTGRPLSSLSDADTAPLLRICHAESYRFLRRLSTHFEDFLLQPHDDPLLKARDIALRNAHQVGDLLLRLFLPSTEAKA